MSSLSVGACAYMPSWLQKPTAGPSRTERLDTPAVGVAPAPAPAPTPTPHEGPALAKRNVFSVSHTALSTKSIPPAQPLAVPPAAGLGPLASSTPLPSSPSLLGGSPSLAKRVPTRMSPAMVPMNIRYMNPNAEEFLPGSGAAGGARGEAAGLNILPCSTADLEAEKRHQDHTPSPPPPPPSSSFACSSVMTTPASNDAANKHHTSVMVSSAARGEGRAGTPPVMPAGQLRRGGSSSPLIAPIPLHLKNEEILAISQSSALKVGAAAYVPRRTMTRVVLSKPSPLMLAADPAKEGFEMLLDDVWSLFYLPIQEKYTKDENYNPTLVFRIESIPTFWKVFNNIPAPTRMPMGTLYLFRDGIDPKWEDPANRNGGALKMKVSSDLVDEAWELLLCRTIGDSWNPVVRNQINGIALKVREGGYILEIWVTKNVPELVSDLAGLWGDLMKGAFATNYNPHLEAQNRSQADKKKRSKKY